MDMLRQQFCKRLRYFRDREAEIRASKKVFSSDQLQDFERE
jgi:hypothetical protein